MGFRDWWDMQTSQPRRLSVGDLMRGSRGDDYQDHRDERLAEQRGRFEARLDQVYNNMEEVKASMRAIQSSVDQITKQMIPPQDWASIQQQVRTLSKWAYMMAGVIALVTFLMPILMKYVFKAD